MDRTTNDKRSPRIAPDGYVWVCCMCGKKSKDRYGDAQSSYGWDESCMLNSFLAPIDELPPAATVS